MASTQGIAKATQCLHQLDQKIRTACPPLGKRVVIAGTSREGLNGRVGVATAFDNARGRYVVELDFRRGPNEKGRLKLK